MELSYLNTVLVEAYRDLDYTNRATKQMARCNKTSQKQPEWPTELWEASEQRIAVLDQQLKDRQPLGLPPSSNDSSPSPPQNQVSHAVETGTQMDDTAHPVVVTVNATTMTNSVQQLVIKTNEKSTQTGHPVPRLCKLPLK